MVAAEARKVRGLHMVDGGYSSRSETTETEARGGSQHAGPAGLTRWAWLAIRVFILVIVGFLIARHVWVNWGRLAEREWSLLPVPLGVSLLLLVAGMVYMGIIWAWQVRTAGLEVRCSRGMAGALIASLGKYLPGKVWAVMGRAHFLHKDGVSLRTAGALSLLSQFALVVAGALCGLVCLPVLWKGTYAWLIPAAMFVVAVGSVGLHPRLCMGVLNFGLKMIRKEPVRLEIRYRQMLWWILLSLSAWVFAGPHRGVGYGRCSRTPGDLRASGSGRA